MSENKEAPRKLTFFEKLPFYIKIGWGLLVMFAAVGDCAGKRELATIIFVVTAAVWAVCRIAQEAIDAWAFLRFAANPQLDEDADEEETDDPDEEQ